MFAKAHQWKILFEKLTREILAKAKRNMTSSEKCTLSV